MSTRLYFALHNTPMANDMTFGQWNWTERPLNILCSFALKGALKSWKNRVYETPGVRTMLDSGAFSAWKSGTEVDKDEFFIEASDPQWQEVAALDVIGDYQASVDNAFSMRDFFTYTANPGRVIPTFHYGEPWELLSMYKEKFNNRVALGGITSIGSVKKMKWLEQCFARAYPCRFHGFGIGSKEPLMAFPFVSADTASWGAVHMYGRSQAAPGLKLPKLGDGERSEHYDLRFEVLKYLEMEHEVRERWSHELAWVEHGLELKVL